jgi:transposase-like protein
MYLWRAVDSEGEILDLLVQSKRDKAAALRLMRKLLRKQGYAPRVLVTDRLRSYAAARRHLGLGALNEKGLRTESCWTLSHYFRHQGWPRPRNPCIRCRQHWLE